MNQKWTTTDLEHGPHEWRRAWHRGHIDAQSAPDRWPRNYDKMSKREQIGYEQGLISSLPAYGCRAYCDTMYASASSVGSPMP